MTGSTDEQAEQLATAAAVSERDHAYDGFEVTAASPAGGDVPACTVEVAGAWLDSTGEWVLMAVLPTRRAFTRRDRYADRAAAIGEARRVAVHLLAAYLRTEIAAANLRATTATFSHGSVAR